MKTVLSDYLKINFINEKTNKYDYKYLLTNKKYFNDINSINKYIDYLYTVNVDKKLSLRNKEDIYSVEIYSMRDEEDTYCDFVFNVKKPTESQSIIYELIEDCTNLIYDFTIKGE